MIDYRNWIADDNPHKLRKPPMWFLKMLYDLDALLVILPSRTGKKYILARRRTLTNNSPLMVVAHNKLLRDTRGSDGDMLATHNLLGIDSITGNVHGAWSPGIIQQLKERDMWTLGGANEYIKKIETEEAKIVSDKRKVFLDDIDHRARDAYRSYQARTGQRSQHSNSTHKQSVKVLKSKLNRPLSSPSSSTAGSGFSVSSAFANRMPLQP